MGGISYYRVLKTPLKSYSRGEGFWLASYRTDLWRGGALDGNVTSQQKVRTVIDWASCPVTSGMGSRTIEL